MKWKLFENIGIKVPEIYLPNSNVDLKMVSSSRPITSQPDYWAEVENYVDQILLLCILFYLKLFGMSRWKQRIETLNQT